MRDSPPNTLQLVPVCHSIVVTLVVLAIDSAFFFKKCIDVRTVQLVVKGDGGSAQSPARALAAPVTAVLPVSHPLPGAWPRPLSCLGRSMPCSCRRGRPCDTSSAAIARTVTMANPALVTVQSQEV